MHTRSFTKHTEQSRDTHTPHHRPDRWLALVLTWTAATLVGSGGARAAGDAPDSDKAIPDAACAAPHDPDHDRDHRFHKRCEHYRHRHTFHRGHDGDATLGVRTLLDAKGNAVLEATTGTFDDGSVPKGAIERLKVRTTRADGKHHDEMNFNPNPAAGFVSAPMGRLTHGQGLSVDAVIDGIDKRDDHVSVDDSVQYRPDLAIVHIDVPATATLGLPISIAATVREMMGDLGATADCLLSADGAVVDRVPAIWVDAGGVVTCHFSTTFTTVGQHSLHVDVGNVRPGDYDLSNNGADATVTMAPQFLFSASAYDATYSGNNMTQVLDSSGNVLYQENDTFSGALQSASLNGSWGMPVTFPLATVSAMATSGGTTWSLIDLANLPAGSSSPTSGTCGAGADVTGYNWITICTGNKNGAPATSVALSEFAGDVTYHSAGVCQQTTAMADCAGGYTWNNGTSTAYAPRHPFSGSLSMNLNVTDAAGTNLQAFPMLPLTPYTLRNSVPQSCAPQPDGTQNCSASGYLETGVKASVNQ
jgi:hypothetical protein